MEVARSFDDWVQVLGYKAVNDEFVLQQIVAAASSFADWKLVEWFAKRPRDNAIRDNAISHMQILAQTFKEWLTLYQLSDTRDNPIILYHLRDLAKSFWDWHEIAYSRSSSQLIQEVVDHYLKPLVNDEQEQRALQFWVDQGY